MTYTSLLNLSTSAGYLDASGYPVVAGELVQIQGSNTSGNTIIGSPNDDTISTYGMGDAIHAGAGNDTVTIYVNGTILGTYDGGSGTNVLSFVNTTPVNLADVNFSNFQGFLAQLGDEIDLTSAQLSWTIVGGGTFKLLDSGNVTLSGNAGSLLGPYGTQVTIELSDAGNTLNLANYAATITVGGGAGNDTIICSDYGNMGVSGGAGNDLIVAAEDPGISDNIDGGTGDNTLIFTGAMTNYTIKNGGGGSLYISDPSGNAYTVANIQTLVFADGTDSLQSGATILAKSSGSLSVTSGNTYVISAATGPYAIKGSGAIVVLSDSNATTTGNSDSLFINTSNATLAVSGSLDSVVAVAQDEAISIGGNGQGATTADTVTLTQGQGSTVTVGDNANVAVTGPGATLKGGKSDTVALAGGNGIIALAGAGDNLSLSATAGAWDTATANNANVQLANAQAGLHGGGNTITFSGGASGNVVGLYDTAGNWDNVTATGDETVYLTNAQAAITGGGEAISFAGGTGNVAGLYDTGGAWDSVWAPGADTVYLTSAQAAVAGGGDTISFAGGTGNVVGLYDTAGAWDSVWAPGGETVYLTSAQAAITGGGNTISFAGGSGNVVGLYNTGDSWDSVWAPGGATIYLTNADAAITGGGDSISFTGGSAGIAGLYDTGGTADTIWAPDRETIFFTSAQAIVHRRWQRYQLCRRYGQCRDAAGHQWRGRQCLGAGRHREPHQRAGDCHRHRRHRYVRRRQLGHPERRAEDAGVFGGHRRA